MLQKWKFVDYKNKVIDSLDYGRPHITISFQSQEYEIGEDILMKVRFRNLTNKKIIIFPSNIEIWYEVFDRDTEEFIQSGGDSRGRIKRFITYEDLSKVGPKKFFLDKHGGKELRPNQVYYGTFNLRDILSPVRKGLVGKYIISLKYTDFELLWVSIKDDEVEYRTNIRVKKGLYDNVIKAWGQFYLEDE